MISLQKKTKTSSKYDRICKHFNSLYNPNILKDFYIQPSGWYSYLFYPNFHLHHNEESCAMNEEWVGREEESPSLLRNSYLTNRGIFSCKMVSYCSTFQVISVLLHNLPTSIRQFLLPFFLFVLFFGAPPKFGGPTMGSNVHFEY